MRHRKRPTLCLSAAVLLTVFVGAWFFMPGSRIKWENYERIRFGMKEKEVIAILGKESWSDELNHGKAKTLTWYDGWVAISVMFQEHRSVSKSFDETTTWQKLSRYAKQGADKVGVEWDPGTAK